MSDICSICLDSYFVFSTTHQKRKFITKCNHVYHYDCIYRWAQQNNSCPTCRTPDLIEEFIFNFFYDYDYNDSDYDNILSSIRNASLNIGNLVHDGDLENFNGYLDSLTNLLNNYNRNFSNYNNIQIINLPLIQNPSNSNNPIILHNPPTPQPINIRMGINNSRRLRTNHRLRSMNFR